MEAIQMIKYEKTHKEMKQNKCRTQTNAIDQSIQYGTEEAPIQVVIKSRGR